MREMLRKCNLKSSYDQIQTDHTHRDSYQTTHELTQP